MARALFKIIPKETVNIVDGDFMGSFSEFGTIIQILIQPESLDTEYSFGIKDDGGFVIYQKYDLIGALSDIIEIPLFPGEKWFIIKGASKDETFRIKLICKE